MIYRIVSAGDGKPCKKIKHSENPEWSDLKQVKPEDLRGNNALKVTYLFHSISMEEGFGVEPGEDHFNMVEPLPPGFKSTPSNRKASLFGLRSSAKMGRLYVFKNEFDKLIAPPEEKKKKKKKKKPSSKKRKSGFQLSFKK